MIMKPSRFVSCFQILARRVGSILRECNQSERYTCKLPSTQEMGTGEGRVWCASTESGVRLTNIQDTGEGVSLQVIDNGLIRCDVRKI